MSEELCLLDGPSGTGAGTQDQNGGRMMINCLYIHARQMSRAVVARQRRTNHNLKYPKTTLVVPALILCGVLLCMISFPLAIF